MILRFLLCKKGRPCIMPNKGFVTALKLYEKNEIY